MPEKRLVIMGMDFGRVREITRGEAPHLHACLDEYKKRLGMNKDVSLYHASNKNLPNAAAAIEAIPSLKIKASSIVLPQALFDLFGQQSLAQAPTEGIKGMMAHELSHLHDPKFYYSFAGHYSLYALPAAAIAAVYLYHRAAARSHEKSGSVEDASVAAHLPGVTDEAAREAQRDYPGMTPHLLRAGSYVAAGALGLGGGLLASRGIMRAAELRADRVAAWLTGDARGYAESLHTMHNSLGKVMEHDIIVKMRAIEPSPTVGEALDRFRRRVKSYIDQERLLTGQLEIWNYHPTQKQRVEALLPGDQVAVREILRGGQALTPSPA